MGSALNSLWCMCWVGLSRRPQQQALVLPGSSLTQDSYMMQSVGLVVIAGVALQGHSVVSCTPSNC